ncbi:MAG: hypothetical protein AMJ68_02630 [Acidithiobacillales bacterium SG8_45]|jgi:uncharacterized protein (DUF1697 family)|nr:MAG: hypothetical protein AMJ68_02630 [Acidithiobacillales bacterium SG8_45]
MAALKTYITLLRGINVSGQKKIRMAELKALYESVGHQDVKTYIQSGNVLLRSRAAKESSISRGIEDAIRKNFGYPVTVLVRTPGDLEKIVKNNPYLENRSVDRSRLYVTFLLNSPEPGLAEAAAEIESGDDTFRVAGMEVFVYCPGGYGKTRLSNTFFEKKLKQVATTRNWNTVNKLLELGVALESM